MPTHPGHPAIASTTLVSASRSLLNDAFDSVSLQTVTATATLNPDDGRYVLVAPASHTTITLPDPSSDERYQNVRLVLKRTTAGVYTATVVVAGGGLIDGSSSTTLNAQYDCEVLFSDGTAWHRLRDQTNLLAPDYLDFGDWIVGTDDSNPAPVATSDAYTAPDGTTTADELEWDNTTELADESWAEPGASVLEAGDGAEYSFYIDSEVGDGIKTVLEVEDTSVPGLLEQTTVAFSNVFAEDLIYPDYTTEGPAGGVTSSIVAPDGTLTAIDNQAISNQIYLRNLISVADYQGREFTVTRYVYSYSLANGSATNYTLQLRNDTTGGTSISAVFQDGTDGWYVSSLSATSAGPALTTANATRSDRIAGTNWFKLSIRVRDYAGTGNRSQLYFRILGTDGRLFTYWNQELRYGDHVSSQQLLTVDDGVENILNSVGIFDAADFDDLPTNVASEGISAIAAPDGTLTAIETVSTSPTLAHNVKVLAFETTGTYTQLGSLWKDGIAWTGSVYVYMGQPNAAKMAVVLQLRDTAGVLQDDVTVTVTDGSITAFSSISSGSVAYSAERNVDLSAVGNSGWYRLSVTVQDHTVTCDRIYFYLYGTSGASYDRFITWSPALRYGDWVARGKNWDSQPDLLSKTIFVNGGGGTTSVTRERSQVVAPDGTLSAVDVTPQGTITNWSYWIELHNPPASNGIPVPSDALVTVEFYLLHPIPFSAPSISYNPQVQVLLVTSGGALVERAYFYIDAAAGGGISTITNITSADPSFYTVANCVDVDPVGSDGWHRYRLRIKDTGGTAAACRAFLILGKQDGGDTTTIWNPRLTVGNPADARGYFVSGPQNLLGDGSDYSSWSVAGSPTLTTNALVAPNGRLEADTINWLNGDTLSKSVTGLSFGAGATSVFYYKYDAALSGALCIKYDSRLRVGTTTTERAVVYINNTNDPATALQSFAGGTTGGPGYTSDDVTITALTNDWMRVEVRLFDYAGTADGAYVRMDAQQATAYDLTLWGSEVTTLDRTPTANELRPVSNGVVDFDAYPPEHRSLFADLEDAGDNWYKVTTKITDI